MPLIDQDDFPQIRAAVSTSASKGDLPDDLIGLDLFVGEAIRWTESQITVTGPEATGSRAKLAAINMAAALLVPSYTQVTAQKDATGETVDMKSFDPIKREAQLRARAAELIALVNDESSTLAERSTSAFRPMTSCISVICPTHHCSRSACGCSGAVLIF